MTRWNDNRARAGCWRLSVGWSKRQRWIGEWRCSWTRPPRWFQNRLSNLTVAMERVLKVVFHDTWRIRRYSFLGKSKYIWIILCQNPKRNKKVNEKNNKNGEDWIIDDEWRPWENRGGRREGDKRKMDAKGVEKTWLN